VLVVFQSTANRSRTGSSSRALAPARPPTSRAAPSTCTTHRPSPVPRHPSRDCRSLTAKRHTFTSWH
jgi:hypothetical protein